MTTAEFLVSIVGGFISGVLSSFVFQKRNRKKETLKILISSGIARTYTNRLPRQAIYRIKISNESEQDAYDIRVCVRLRYKGKYLTNTLNPVPILHGNNGINKPFDYQRKFSFRMSDFSDERIKQLNENSIKTLYKSKKLELGHFKHDETILEIVVTAIDSIGGSRYNVSVMTFYYKDFTSKIINGTFHRDSLKIIPYKEEGSEETNGNNN